MEAKRAKGITWKKMRKKDTKIRDKYKGARNDYIRIRGKEERNFEKNVVKKCGEEPKFFYK